jgi:hypothetical protein
MEQAGGTEEEPPPPPLNNTATTEKKPRPRNAAKDKSSSTSATRVQFASFIEVVGEEEVEESRNSFDPELGASVDEHHGLHTTYHDSGGHSSSSSSSCLLPQQTTSSSRRNSLLHYTNYRRGDSMEEGEDESFDGASDANVQQNADAHTLQSSSSVHPQAQQQLKGRDDTTTGTPTRPRRFLRLEDSSQWKSEDSSQWKYSSRGLDEEEKKDADASHDREMTSMPHSNDKQQQQQQPTNQFLVDTSEQSLSLSQLRMMDHDNAEHTSRDDSDQDFTRRRAIHDDDDDTDTDEEAMPSDSEEEEPCSSTTDSMERDIRNAFLFTLCSALGLAAMGKALDKFFNCFNKLTNNHNETTDEVVELAADTILDDTTNQSFLLIHSNSSMGMSSSSNLMAAPPPVWGNAGADQVYVNAYTFADRDAIVRSDMLYLGFISLALLLSCVVLRNKWPWRRHRMQLRLLPVERPPLPVLLRLPLLLLVPHFSRVWLLRLPEPPLPRKWDWPSVWPLWLPPPLLPQRRMLSGSRLVSFHPTIH